MHANVGANTDTQIRLQGCVSEQDALYDSSMDIKAAIETSSTLVNAGGQYYLAFPYTSVIGKEVQDLTVKIPIKSENASAKDKTALLEAVTVQGGIGRWIQKEDRSIWLIPAT